MVLHISFYEFKKIKNLAQNPKMFAFSFTQKPQFTTKTDRKSIFFVCDPHIPDRLYLMVMYISFTDLKKLNFDSKSKG
jgi:hypothetical protein